MSEPYPFERNYFERVVRDEDDLEQLAIWPKLYRRLMKAFGTDPGGPPDFDGNGDVDTADFLIFLAHFGPCP